MSMLQAMSTIGQKIDIFQVFKAYHRDNRELKIRGQRRQRKRR